MRVKTVITTTKAVTLRWKSNILNAAYTARLQSVHSNRSAHRHSLHRSNTVCQKRHADTLPPPPPPPFLPSPPHNTPSWICKHQSSRAFLKRYVRWLILTFQEACTSLLLAPSQVWVVSLTGLKKNPEKQKQKQNKQNKQTNKNTPHRKHRSLLNVFSILITLSCDWGHWFFCKAAIP